MEYINIRRTFKLSGLYTTLLHSQQILPIGFYPFGPFCFESRKRPALRKASRMTYSICALTLRSSSSDQRRIASQMEYVLRDALRKAGRLRDSKQQDPKG